MSEASKIFQLPHDQFEKVMKFSEIASIQDIISAFNILESYNWDVQMALNSIDFSQYKKAILPADKSNLIDKHNKIQRRYKQLNQSNISNQSELLLGPILFNSYIQSIYKFKWNFSVQSLRKSLQTSRQQIKFLLFYVHSKQIKNQKKYKDTFEKIANDKHIVQFVDTHCILYGQFQQSQDFDSIKHFVQNHTKYQQCPLFLLIKKDRVRQDIKFIAFYRMDFEDQYLFLEWLALYTQIIVDFERVRQQSRIHRYKLKKDNQNNLLNKQKDKQPVPQQQPLKNKIPPLNNKIRQNILKKPLKHNKRNLQDYKQFDYEQIIDINENNKMKMKYPDAFINKQYQYNQYDFLPEQQLREDFSDEDQQIIPYDQKKQEKPRHIGIQQKQRQNLNNKFKSNPISEKSIISHQNRQFQELQKQYYKKRQISKIFKEQIINKQAEISKRQLDMLKKINKQQQNDSVIQLKLRLPNGKSQVQKFNMNDSIEQLFFVVECYYRSSFQDKNGNFDILYDFKSISGRKEESFHVVFQGIQQCNAIVKQL